ncbi:hypothetical protein GCM10023083_26920 [Streptomyces phyllanthi]
MVARATPVPSGARVISRGRVAARARLAPGACRARGSYRVCRCGRGRRNLAALRLSCLAPCLGRFPRLAPVPSPPGTPRTQVIGPLAQSATALHISTRLLF